jgi:hypothetical protein
LIGAPRRPADLFHFDTIFPGRSANGNVDAVRGIGCVVHAVTSEPPGAVERKRGGRAPAAQKSPPALVAVGSRARPADHPLARRPECACISSKPAAASWTSAGKSSNSCTWRISITSLLEAGQRFAHSIASSFEPTSIIQ